ncbi:MAG: ABC transporter permease [Bacteroidetes bacterium]|nr:MAG: ABC transporter permease [Bacteroidota bacterium]
MIFRRIWQGVWVIWGVITLLFLIFYALGDPVEYIVGDNADEATRASVRTRYGLDQPLPVQYLRYLNQLSPIGYLPDSVAAETPHLGLVGPIALKAPDMGRSYQTQAPVSQMLASRMEGTLILAAVSIVLAGIPGILLGVVAALKRHSVWDKGILAASVIGISAPSFFVAVVIVWLFAVKWQSWTGLQAGGYLFEENIFSPGRHIVWKNLLLPALALGLRPLAVFIQLTRSSMADVLGADYVRTARAKGLPPLPVVLRHALRNALNPVITSVTGWLASLLAGAFFVEYIFDWQGVGKLTIDALNTNDFPVIIGCTLVVAAIFVVFSILTDLLYAWTDPRVRL